MAAAKRESRGVPRSSSGNQQTAVRKAAVRPTAENTAIWRRPGNGVRPSARYASTLVPSASTRPGSKLRISVRGGAPGWPWRAAK